MIAIEAIASYIPIARENNLEKSLKFQMEPGFVEEKIGAIHTSRAGPEEFASDMCLSAYAELKKATGLNSDEIDCVVVCTQNPDHGGLPHVSARVHGGIAARETCACFDIGLGCSGYVYALSVVRAFMESNGFRQGLLFTSDPYSKIVDPEDRNTSLLFGDAATVTLLSDQGDWLPSQFLFGTRGSAGHNLQIKDGKLEMNGRAVFNFSATAVPAQVEILLNNSGLGINDIDLYFFHQGSRYIVENLSSRLGIPSERVPMKLAEQGNTISSSIPLMLQDYIGQRQFRRFLLSGFGVGLSWASCILTRIDRND